MLTLSTTLKYYKQRHVQEAILAHAANREVSVRFGGGGFGKRPDILTYPQDVLDLVTRGATSFHVSEEIWSNPLHLKKNITIKEMDQLRQGWDLILDIDSPDFEISRLTAKYLIKALQYYGVECISIKFSGNKGFHIGVPFAAFPSMMHGKETRLLFPDGPRKIAALLTDMVKEPIAAELLGTYEIAEICMKTNKTQDELYEKGNFNPFKVIEVDTVLIASRHLYRMPYSLHEKSGLASIPIPIDQVETFQREDADPKKIKTERRFLAHTEEHIGQAQQLMLQAFDAVQPKETYVSKNKPMEVPTEAIKEEQFPPCMKLILNGLEDGKKRGMFALVNFFAGCGWSHEMIEKRIKEWNQKNEEQLKENIIIGQLRHHKQKKELFPPPSCTSEQYYVSMGVCKPDNLCQRIKNPIQYAKRRHYFVMLDAKKAKATSQQQPSQQDNTD